MAHASLNLCLLCNESYCSECGGKEGEVCVPESKKLYTVVCETCYETGHCEVCDTIQETPLVRCEQCRQTVCQECFQEDRCLDCL
jgi:hypothetical protein